MTRTINKSLKLMHVSALVPAPVLYEVLSILQNVKAFNVETRVYLPTTERPDKTDQNALLLKAVQTRTPVAHIIERTGISKATVYAALARAAKAKLIKRVKPGFYSLTAKGETIKNSKEGASK